MDAANREALRACRRSGQMSEAQWRAHCAEDPELEAADSPPKRPYGGVLVVRFGDLVRMLVETPDESLAFSFTPASARELGDLLIAAAAAIP